MRNELIIDTEKHQLHTFALADTHTHRVEGEMWDIHVQPNGDGCLNVVGEIPGDGQENGATMLQILLQFAETCNQASNLIQSYRKMGSFGVRMGEAIAESIRDIMPHADPIQQAALAIETVLRSLSPQLTIPEIHFELDCCPLCEASASSDDGRKEDLAHHALIALCQSMVQAIDPRLQIRMPTSPHSAHNAVLRIRPA
jgi:hypothetical protein